MLNLEVSQIIIQIIAFLAMLWVMKRYGWGPLLQILEERKNKIKAEFNLIDTRKAEVEELNVQYQDKLKGIDADRRKKIQEAVAEGQKISSDIQADAQLRAREILDKAISEVEGEIVRGKIQLKNDIVNLVVNTTETILQKELDASSQKQLITRFLDEAQL